MELRQAIENILDELPEPRLREVLHFARFIAMGRDEEEWRDFGKSQLSRAYGTDEPEYTEADIKHESISS